MDPMNVSAKFEIRSFTRSYKIKAIDVLGGGCEEEAVGSGMVPLETALVSSYRPSMVTFSLYLHVSEILSLLCSSAPLFPTHL